MRPEEALGRVIAAASRNRSELLEQASKYYRLGQPAAAEETMELHYKPLDEAIRMVSERAMESSSG